MNGKKCHAVAAVILSLLFQAGAKALTINFDPSPGDLPSALTAMGNSPGSPVPSNAQLSNQYDFDGVLFSSTDSFIAVVDNGGSSASPPNAIGGVTADGLLSYADPVKVTFVDPGTLTPGVTTNVSIVADSVGIPGQFATLRAFGIHGNLLAAQTLNDVGGEIWSLNAPGIHSALFNFPTTSTGAPTTGSAFGNGTGIALDNLTFGTITTAPTGSPTVPLPPAAWTGLAVLGALFLSKRRIGLSLR
jgi:hypothetical protein